MHSSIYKLITSHTCYSQIHKTLPTSECTCYFPALCCAVYPKAQATDSFTPGSNSSRQMTRVSTVPQSSAQNINVIHTKYQYHPNKVSTSSTQNINVTNIKKNLIHTRYQYQPHTTSMSSTHDINVILT